MKCAWWILTTYKDDVETHQHVAVIYSHKILSVAIWLDKVARFVRAAGRCCFDTGSMDFTCPCKLQMFSDASRAGLAGRTTNATKIIVFCRANCWPFSQAMVPWELMGGGLTGNLKFFKRSAAIPTQKPRLQKQRATVSSRPRHQGGCQAWSRQQINAASLYVNVGNVGQQDSKEGWDISRHRPVFNTE